VSDVKWARRSEEPGGAIYVPLEQGAPGAMRLLVATAGPRAPAVLEQIRAIVRSIDRDIPVDRVTTLERLLADAVDQPRFLAQLLAAFAIGGLLLGALGIYGTVTDLVSQRRREIGVRLALGAQRRDIVRSVLRGTMLVAFAGAAIGVLLAAAATRGLAALLFGVAPTDPWTFASSTGILTLTALLAGYLPARRAARLDPLRTLRTD
jgi:putative ABC transport system permease protein